MKKPFPTDLQYGKRFFLSVHCAADHTKDEGSGSSHGAAACHMGKPVASVWGSGWRVPLGFTVFHTSAELKKSGEHSEQAKQP